MRNALVLLALLLAAVGDACGQSRQARAYNDRILVVGGGGARGAWGAGLAKKLTADFGPYRKAFGTSTGSLMIPFIILNDFETLERSYTGISQRDIFNVNPFSEKTGELKLFNAVWRILIGKETFGESENLRKTIKAFLSADMFDQIKTSAQGLEFVVTVVDFTTGQEEYKSSKEIADYEQMVDWMWASSNQPLFMSYYNVGGHAYVDGGVMENVPLKFALKYALDNGHKEVDVIINKPIDPVIDKEFPNRKILKGLNRLIEFFTLEIRNDDLFIPQLQAELEKCRQEYKAAGLRMDAEPTINIFFYYFPKEAFHGLNVKDLVFDQERMRNLWELGYAGKKDEEPALAAPAIMQVPVSLLKELLKKP